MACCKDFERESTQLQAMVGGGWLYPPEMHPAAQIEQDEDGSWHVNDTSGGGGCVLSDIKFCPFCGNKLPGEGQ